MAKISSYLPDNSISGEDLLTGSNYISLGNYDTRTFKIKDLTNYFAGQIIVDPSVLSLKTNGGLVYETVNSTNFLAVDLGASNITGQLANADLVNSSITINGAAVSLGGSVDIPVGDITTVTAGTYLSGGGTTGDVTINHDSTSRSDTTSTPSQLGYGSTFTAITSTTTNATGHLTAINTATYTLPASDNTDTIPNDGLLDINEGTDISLTITGGDFTADKSTETDIVINHADITRTNTTDASTIAHGNTFTAITSLTSSARGHVTGAETTTYTMPTGPADATIQINAGIYLSGGGDFTTNQTSNETLSISHNSTNRSDSTTSSTLSGGSTFTAITTASSNGTGHLTGVNTQTYTLPDTATGLEAIDSSSDAIIRLVRTGTDDEVKLEAGANITLNVDETNDTIEIVASGFGNVYEAASQSAQLALTTSQGDIVIRTDESKTYIDNGGTAGTMADYTELQFSGIQNINLTAADEIELSRTSLTQTNNNLTIGHLDVTRTNTTSTDNSNSAEDTFTVIDSITSNARGHITGVNTKTVTFPPDSDTQLSTEQVQDIIGGMVSGNTETRISVTYDDPNGKLDFVVDDMNYTLPLAADGTRGGVQIGYTENGKNYPVELSSEKMFVNVPWVNTTYSEATSSTLGLVKIGYTTSGKNYAVQLDSGQMYVNVPWTDNNDDVDVNVSNLETRLGQIGNTSIGSTGSTITIPNLTVTGTQTINNVEVVSTSNGVIFEGATDDAHETTLGVIDPTADRTVNLPNDSGTVLLVDNVVAGNNISISANTANDTITIASTDTNTTYSAGVGLVLDGTTFKANFIDETLRSVTAETISTTANRTYAVMPDADGDLVVNVPWSDTNDNDNTTYDLSVPESTTKIRLTGSDSTDDDVEIFGGTNVTVTRNSANKLTIAATDTNTNKLTTFKVRDDDNDEATIGQDKFIKFVSATGTAGTNLSGTGTSSDPFVMTITNPDTVASTVWNLIDGDGTSKAINNNKHVKFIEGNDININYTDVDNGTASDPFDLQFSHKDTTRTNAASDEGTLSYGGTITAISALTSNARGHVTEVTTSTWQLPAAYSHPSHNGDDIDVDTGALTGATVISDLDFNITTNALGHVTDANGTVSTRNLTPSDIGAATDDHTHPASDITSGTFNVNRYLKPTSGDWFNNGVGIVGTDGVMEIGRYIDFHHSDTTTADYSVRLDCESANVLNVVGGSLEVGGYTVWDENDFTATNVSNWNTAYGDKVNSVSFDTSNGILTLTRQDGGTVTRDLDGRYVLDTGDTVNGTLRIASAGWLTAEGNVTSYPPNSQGLSFGWNRSGGSRESEILFSGGTTSHSDATLYIRSFVAGDEGVSASEVQYLKFGASDQAIVVDSTKKLMFNNSNTYINSPSNTNLDISASNTLKLLGDEVEIHTNSSKRFEILSNGSAKFYGDLTIDGCLITGDDCPTTFENLQAGSNSNNYSSTNKPPAADLNDNGTWDGAQFKFKGGIYIPHRMYHFQSSEFTGNSAANPYDLSYRIFSHNFFIVPEGKYILLPYKRWGRPTGTVSKYGNYVDNNANTWLTVTNFSQNDGPNFNVSANVPAKNYKMNFTGVNGSAPTAQDPIILDYRYYDNQWQIKVQGQQNLSNSTVSFHNFYLDRRSDPETSATNVPHYNDIPEGTTITIVGGAKILGVIGRAFAKVGLAREAGGEAYVSTGFDSSYYEDFIESGASMSDAGKAQAVTLTYVRQHTWPDSTYKNGGINEDTHLQNVYGWVATSIADTPY